MPRATLRVGLHNVNGLSGKLHSLVQQWHASHFDVVAVVDTHVGFAQRTAVELRLMMHGWRSFWCLAYHQGGQDRAGVCILIKNSLLTSGVIQLKGEPQPAASVGPAQGRILRLPVQWGRQVIDLVAVYLHASNVPATLAIINGPLQHIAAMAPQDGLLMLGDFNFVHNTCLDRRGVVAPEALADS